MRILPNISQPTLDSFRKDVYRPRLALILLIVLLAGKKEALLGGVSERSSLPANLENHQAIDPAPVDSTFSSLRLSRILGPLTSKRHKTKQRKKAKEKAEAVNASISRSKSKTKRKTNTTDDLSSVSILRLPSLGLKYLLQGQALSAIIPLHILWIVRLAGMMVEDGIVKSTTAAQRSHSADGTVMVKLAVLALLSLSSLLLTSSSSLQQLLSTVSLGSYSLDTSKASTDPSLAISLRLIVTLELTATLLSLCSPLMKLNSPLLIRILPRSVNLPSPSHSPSIADMLPLPSGLADIITGRSSNMQTRTGRRAGIAAFRQDIAADGARHGAVAAPLTLPDQSSPGSIPKRAPRVKGLKTKVDSSWLLENVIVLWGYLIGSFEYLIVALALPTLTPTSFPIILTLLSLRSQLSALVLTWTNARASIECLEFARRRWASSHMKPRWKPGQEVDVLCPVCLEQIERQSKDESIESCCLDCGHELHAVCLVQIFLGAKQAHCPLCHDPLKATPSIPPVNSGAIGPV